MSVNQESEHKYTTLTIKRKSIACFQILRLLSGKDTTQFMEDFTDALEPILSKSLSENERVNIDIKRIGSMVQVSLIPKFSVKERKSKPITARFSKEGKFKGVVEK